MITADDLLVAEIFGDLPASDREFLAGLMTEVVIPDGGSPFEPDSPAENLIVILSGGMQVSLRRGDAWRHLDTLAPGKVTGLLPYSRMKVFPGKSLAIGDLRMAMLPKTCFAEALYRVPEIGQPLIGLMSDRVRSGVRANQQRDKMLALGKFSAGLAHEINNPAAAVIRAAADLRVRIDALPGVVANVAAHGLQPEKVNPAGGFCTMGGANPRLSPMELGDREDAILDWLEDREVDEAWALAPTLAEAGVTVADLELAARDVPAAAVGSVVTWIEQSLGASKLLDEINAAAGRISELVGSVKSYSHMDRSDEMQPTNVVEGIENTLTMLGHKLKKKAITVQKSLTDLPPIPGHPGELNQVWTNLIDNAVDAMEDGGTLSVSARTLGERVQIKIGDNGHGIPAEALERIFEPFFSTKDVGEGTGLGLEIAHRIITKEHLGQISVTSEPGKTVFIIDLPLE